MIRGPWSKAEDTSLRRLVGERTPVPAIAAALDRSKAAVAMRKNKLRLMTYGPKAAADVARVEELYAVGTPVKTIAKRLGTTPARVIHAIRDNGLVNARSYSVGGSLPLDDELQRLSAEGMRVADIARTVGQNPVRVRGRLVTLARREAIAEARAEAFSSTPPEPPRRQHGDP